MRKVQTADRVRSVEWLFLKVDSWLFSRAFNWPPTDADFRLRGCIFLKLSSAGVINLLDHCWGAVMQLMARGDNVPRVYYPRGRFITRIPKLSGLVIKKHTAKKQV